MNVHEKQVGAPAEGANNLLYLANKASANKNAILRFAF